MDRAEDENSKTVRTVRLEERARKRVVTELLQEYDEHNASTSTKIVKEPVAEPTEKMMTVLKVVIKN